MSARKRTVRFGDDVQREAISAGLPVSPGLLGFGEFTLALLSSPFRPLFEKSDLPLIKTIFLEDGLPGTLLGCHRKSERRTSLGRFTDTYAKFKIFISKNFEDLKRAFLFYHCADRIHFYQTYNDFIEKICDTQQYKTFLKGVRFVGLIESRDESFVVHRHRLQEVMSAAAATSLSEKVNFYHKLNYYRHFKKLKVVDEPEVETAFIDRLRRTDRDGFVAYVTQRIWLLAQTVLGKTVSDFEITFFFDADRAGVMAVDRIQVERTPFVNSEDDEDNFEALVIPSVKLTAKTRFQRVRGRRSGGDGADSEGEEGRVEVSAQFKPMQEKIQRQTSAFLTSIQDDFQRTLACKFESDVCFRKLFPEAKLALSTLLKFEQQDHLLHDYVQKMREERRSK